MIWLISWLEDLKIQIIIILWIRGMIKILFTYRYTNIICVQLNISRLFFLFFPDMFAWIKNCYSVTLDFKHFLCVTWHDVYLIIYFLLHDMLVFLNALHLSRFRSPWTQSISVTNLWILPFISIIFMPNYIYTTKTILVDTSHTLLKYVFIGKKIIACFHLYYQNP